MSYCTTADVQAEFKALTFTSTSMVTDSNVAKMIMEADALINSYVGARWVTPITADANSLALMSLFSRTLVADRVRGVIANKQQTNTDANQQVKSDGYSTKNVISALTDIKNGNMTLSGATLLLANAAMFSNNQDINTQVRFKKQVRQW